MGFFSFLQATPLLTAGVWLALVGYLAARDRFRTWTEVLLLALCGSLGAYALSDFAFLNAATYEAAETAARLSLTLLSAAALVFLLFAFVLRDRMRPRLALVLVPAAGGGILVWIRLVVGAVPAADVGLPYRVVYDAVALDAWATYALTYAALSLGLFAQTFASLKAYVPKAVRRLRLLLLALLLALFSGASTNLLAALLGLHVPPLFSTLLAVPGVLAFAALTPASELPFVEASARWKARGYGIRAAFLTFEDGTLIGRRVRPGELAVDSDGFASTLDLIQNFMRTSFPRLGEKALQSVTQGDFTLVIERGGRVYLTLVLEGRENDQLRRLMREALRAYERTNRELLARWRGVPEEAEGTEAMLASFLEERAE